MVLKWPGPLSPQMLLNYVKVFTAPFDAMNLSALTQLQLSTSDRIEHGSRLLGKLPLLKWVHVQGYAAESLLDASVYKTKAANESRLAMSSSLNFAISIWVVLISKRQI